MTTKVEVKIAQQHMPVIVEVLGSDGRMLHAIELQTLGAATEEYVHSGQTLRIREKTTAEMVAS